MYFDAENILENKLILLYAFNQCKAPLTKGQISQIIIENIQISYFDIQFLIDSLLEDGYLSSTPHRDDHVYAISETGRQTLSLFIDRIPAYLREMLDLFIRQNRDHVLKDVRSQASYLLRGDGDFAVSLRLVENDVELMELTVHVPNKAQAKYICNNWESRSTKIYSDIIQALIKED
jgi:hypothetical protein